MERGFGGNPLALTASYYARDYYANTIISDVQACFCESA